MLASVAANRWLQLIRPANVVTALADVLAGYAVAGLADRRALCGFSVRPPASTPAASS